MTELVPYAAIQRYEDRILAVEPRRAANFLLYLIATLFLVAIIWASFTKIDRTVRANGQVIPSAKLQVVSNLEGGVVEAINVKPGDRVQKGAALIRLSPTLSGAAYDSSEAGVKALEAKADRLRSEVLGKTPSLASANAQDVQTQMEQSLYASRRSEYSSLIAAAEARVSQASRQVAEAQASLAAKRSSLNAAERELDMIRPLAEKLIVPKIDLVRAENAASVARSEVDAANSALSRAQSGVAEARASLAQQRSDWKSRAANELTQVQADLASQKSTLPALQDKVSRTVIRAPMSGIVNRVLVNTVGGSVAAGEPVVEIVPVETVLLINASVRPSDIANVRLGQKARIEITAYNSAIFGWMQGEVVSISPDAIYNEALKESFYSVEVRTVGKALSDSNGKPNRTSKWKSSTVSPVTVRNRSGSSLVITS
ncbi:HlyD family type I secretion periplasmic adaptor subunit [uncultured Sphingorhabdus sp.]|uniref:HlyD family type I secretion periplasmic adaptor subunit n=1 Tax=uncultured Sphingorhabdus sp. TaxID=1686106 RepID=UPI00262ABDE2|nr:HlyD family type I secretion periplasmic adaptor subunit [uncultured Sphingorhabdus sp.]HMS21990.1 HlyD family type I secretion periplasmic adaptor subunit [Sphingorhabdus sp.]